MTNRPFVFYILLVTAMITWGLSWASGKYISKQTLPQVIIFWRFFFTFVSLLPVVYFVEKSLLISRKAIMYVVGGGIFMSLYNYFFFQGLQNGFAGAGGVLVTTMNPVFTFIFVTALQKHRILNKEFAGLFFGLLGGLIMIRVWKFSGIELLATGNLFFLGASLTWAYMTILTQYSAASVSALKYTFYVHVVAAAVSFIPASQADWTQVFDFSASFWMNVLYLSIISTTFGTTVYFAASQKLGSKTASSFIFVVPMMALLGGIVFLQERPDLILLSGGSLSLVAVYLINFSKTRKDKPSGTS